MKPIPACVGAGDHGSMVQLAIRCHPCAPVAPDTLEGWLEGEMTDLRAQAPQATMRLSRLTQRRAEGDLDVGWLVELELDDADPMLTGPRLADVLRDMRLLGLSPTLLAPYRPGANGKAA
jgi:hypothetical protein